jgi:hypothetical protein
MMSGPYLYEMVKRVPDISDEHIAMMRHIEPVLKFEYGCYRRIAGMDKIDPRNVAFNWDENPIGGEFAFDTLNQVEVATQHRSSIFFKPSLAEVYAWILFYLGDNWRFVRFFHMGEWKRCGGSTDVICNCTLLGGRILVKGKQIKFCDGSIGYQMEEVPS